MARRSIATVHRPAPHVYRPSPDDPGDHHGNRRCTCGLPKSNSCHQLPDTGPAQAEHLRRIGEDQ